MSLYGLDILVDKEGKHSLVEINGVRSGMKGFSRIYGDDRIEKTVLQMLQQRYGKLTRNDGTYREEKYRKEHKLGYALFRSAKFLSRLINYFNQYPQQKRHLSKHLKYSINIPSFKEMEKQSLKKTKFDGIEIYRGQASAIINILNEPLPHQGINSVVAEEIAHHKFLQNELLKKTELKEYLPPTLLVGCGWADPGIDSLLKEGNFFVRKPLSAEQGKGIQIINSEELEFYKGIAGPLTIPKPFLQRFLETYALLLLNKNPFNEDQLKHFYNLKYLEEFVAEGDFSFEPEMSIVQPFVSSFRDAYGIQMYSSIRSIVCNGSFIDAYARVCPDPVTNLSRSAMAYPIEDKKKIADLSEKIVGVYERECAKYVSPNFKADLYGSYFQEKSRITEKFSTASKLKNAPI